MEYESNYSLISISMYLEFFIGKRNNYNEL